MNGNKTWSAAAALLLLAVVAAGCGGGGSAAPANDFTLTGVDPDMSVDLNGGDRVRIDGTNLLDLEVGGAFTGTVYFGSAIAFDSILVDPDEGVDGDEYIEATVPPAPGGLPGAVSITVKAPGFPTRAVPNLFTYRGLSGPPVIDSIFPTSFTPSGAELFTIQGSNLGVDGETTIVFFEGVGPVEADVTLGGQIAEGRAPLVVGIPPLASISVSVDNGVGNTIADTRVNYSWAPPTALPLPFQQAGYASRAVRLNDGVAILCTSGPNSTWSDANDDIFLVYGPPNSPGITPVRDGIGAPAGHLDRYFSTPLALDEEVFVVYSVGPNGTPRDQDDQLIVVDTSANPPTMTRHGLPFFPNTPPLLALSPTEVVMTSVGAVHATPPAPIGPTAIDELVIVDISGPGISVRHTGALGPIDVTRNSPVSAPFTWGGDFLYVVTLGADFLPRTADDILHRIEVASMGPGTATSISRSIPSLYGDPVALGSDLVVVPGAGTNTLPGTPDDVLMVFRVIGGALSRVDRPLGTAHGFGATVSVERVGPGGVAMPLAVDPIFNFPPEDLGIFVDPVNGTLERFALPSAPLIAPLYMASNDIGSRSIVMFDRGGDFIAGTDDDQVIAFDGDIATARQFAGTSYFTQLYVPPSDANRVFVVSLGADGAPFSGDERLHVFQTLALDTDVDLAILPALAGNAPLDGSQPMIPIGPGWGVIQSPGPNAIFGTGAFGGDDQIVIVRY